MADRDSTCRSGIAELKVISPDWPAPANVHACFTTRVGGFSEGDWESLNLATHVGDNPSAVSANRNHLRSSAGLPSDPLWLDQIHGARVIDAAQSNHGERADASYTTQKRTICAVMVADCLPILLTSAQGTWVAAVHAGWRGLEQQIIRKAVGKYGGPAEQLMAWIGPAISAQAYVVGEDLRQQLTAAHPDWQKTFQLSEGQWHFDLRALAVMQMQNLGLQKIYHDERCVHDHSQDFFSYRRDKTCGRMAAMIWIDGQSV